MAAGAAATMVRVAVVAMLLMQCCNVMVLAARPLVNDAAAADGRGWQRGQAAGGAQPAAQVVVAQKKISVPGEGNPSGWIDPNHNHIPLTTTTVGLGSRNSPQGRG
ncbi:hypothetical protein BAE44_0022521 [Dichanthelium oligosanthes]|uniref:Uncharacterized protein n=1 Tax=Dichanthelium oligosanthes TaxID=888268 RepID=A0A1E5UUB4_9POAL|nr:hypothetical protein BAE44_0022521 [Dichanthelium oligosanthes]